MTRRPSAAVCTRDELVAEILLRGEASVHDISQASGIHRGNLTKRVFPRLAERGLPVQEVGRYNDRAFGNSRRGRQTTLYRIVLPRGRVCCPRGLPDHSAEYEPERPLRAARGRVRGL